MVLPGPQDFLTSVVLLSVWVTYHLKARRRVAAPETPCYDGSDNHTTRPSGQGEAATPIPDRR